MYLRLDLFFGQSHYRHDDNLPSPLINLLLCGFILNPLSAMLATESKFLFSSDM